MKKSINRDMKGNMNRDKNRNKNEFRLCQELYKGQKSAVILINTKLFSRIKDQ